MNFDLQAGNSPLASRQNPIIYAVLIVGLIVISVFFILWLITKKIKEHQQTPEWIQKESERPTKKADIIAFADKNLMKPEAANLLWKIFRKYKIRNILYSIKQFQDIDGFFHMYYDEIKNNGNENEINQLFNLKFNMEKIFAASESVSSTHALIKNQRISEIFPDGSKIPFKVFENKKEHLIIEITEEFYSSETKPQQMDKVAFTFHSATGMRYAFVSRLIRYEKTPAGNCIMLVSHSNDMIVKQQRNYKRISTNEKCRISSVKIETDRRGRQIYTPAENRYECTLINISGGGCCIATTLPVKEGQLIYTELTLSFGSLGVFGKIIKTRRSKIQGVFNLHVCFDKISIPDQNKIIEKVYGYD